MERQLIIIAKRKASNEEREFAISEGAEIIFGRGMPELIDDDCLSRQHFVVKFDKDGVRVRHLSQINKTWCAPGRTQRARVIEGEIPVNIGQFLYAGVHRFELREIRGATNQEEQSSYSGLDSWDVSMMPVDALPKGASQFQRNRTGTPFPITESDAYYQAKDIKPAASPSNSNEPPMANPALPHQLPAPLKPHLDGSESDLGDFSELKSGTKSSASDTSKSSPGKSTPNPTTGGFATRSQAQGPNVGEDDSLQIDANDFDDFDDFEEEEVL